MFVIIRRAVKSFQRRRNIVVTIERKPVRDNPQRGSERKPRSISRLDQRRLGGGETERRRSRSAVLDSTSISITRKFSARGINFPGEMPARENDAKKRDKNRKRSLRISHSLISH